MRFPILVIENYISGRVKSIDVKEDLKKLSTYGLVLILLGCPVPLEDVFEAYDSLHFYSHVSRLWVKKFHEDFGVDGVCFALEEVVLGLLNVGFLLLVDDLKACLDFLRVNVGGLLSLLGFHDVTGIDVNYWIF